MYCYVNTFSNKNSLVTYSIVLDICLVHDSHNYQLYIVDSSIPVCSVARQLYCKVGEQSLADKSRTDPLLPSYREITLL